MKLTRKILTKLVEEVLNEQPPQQKPPKKSSPGGEQGGQDTQTDLKINIPDTPFNPDAEQIVNRLKKVLGDWEKKKYPSDEIRWKLYYKDIAELVKQIEGEG